MTLSCNNCEELLNIYLCDVPKLWKDSIINILCGSLEIPPPNLGCIPTKNCESLTSLSSFTKKGNNIAIIYLDEAGIEHTRSFEFNDLTKNLLTDIDPKCISTKEIWAEMTHIERLQAIITGNCNCCTEVIPITTSTTTTTTIPPCTCQTFKVTNITTTEQDISFKNCDSNPIINTITLSSSESIFICSCLENISYIEGNLLIEYQGNNCFTPTTTTSSTTTTTTLPFLTTTTTTTTIPVCSCYRVTYPIIGFPINLKYTDCNNLSTSKVIYSGTTKNFCAIGSITNIYPLIIENLGECDTNCTSTTTTTTQVFTTTSTTTTTTIGLPKVLIAGSSIPVYEDNCFTRYNIKIIGPIGHTLNVSAIIYNGYGYIDSNLPTTFISNGLEEPFIFDLFNAGGLGYSKIQITVLNTTTGLTTIVNLQRDNNSSVC